MSFIDLGYYTFETVSKFLRYAAAELRHSLKEEHLTFVIIASDPSVIVYFVVYAFIPTGQFPLSKSATNRIQAIINGLFLSFSSEKIWSQNHLTLHSF